MLSKIFYLTSSWNAETVLICISCSRYCLYIPYFLDIFNEVTTVDVNNISSFLNEVYVRKSSGEKLVIPSENLVFRFSLIFFFCLKIYNQNYSQAILSRYLHRYWYLKLCGQHQYKIHHVSAWKFDFRRLGVKKVALHRSFKDLRRFLSIDSSSSSVHIQMLKNC